MKKHGLFISRWFLVLTGAVVAGGCTETKKKAEEVTDQVSGYRTIQQGEKAKETLERITEERNRDLEAASRAR